MSHNCPLLKSVKNIGSYKHLKHFGGKNRTNRIHVFNPPRINRINQINVINSIRVGVESIDRASRREVGGANFAPALILKNVATNLESFLPLISFS